MVTQDADRINPLLRHRPKDGIRRKRSYGRRPGHDFTVHSYKTQIRMANENPTGIVVPFPPPGRGQASRNQISTLNLVGTNSSISYMVSARDPHDRAIVRGPSEETKSKIIQIMLSRRGSRGDFQVSFTWKGIRQSTQQRPATTIQTLHPVAREFSSGVSGITPEASVVEMVDRIIQAVIGKTHKPEYSVDSDGALSFETTLKNGTFIMCEVSLAGNINAGLYSDTDSDLERFMARATEEELLDLF